MLNEHNTVFAWSGPLYATGVSLGPPESTTQTASRSLQPKTVKIITRHSVRGSFDREFSAFVIATELLKSQDLKFFENLCVFFEKKRPLKEKFWKKPFRKFTWRHRLTLLCWNVVKFPDGKSAKSRVIYLTKKNKISAPCQIVATAWIASKICQGQPQTLAHKFPDFIQIGSLLAEL